MADDMDTACAAANAELERKAAGLSPVAEGEDAESDFVDGADLSGADDAPRAYTFVVSRGTRQFRLSEPDDGTYNRLLEATRDADARKKQLTRASARVQMAERKLNKRYAAAVEAGNEEALKEIEAQMDQNDAETHRLEEETRALVLAPRAAMYEVLEFCLRGWVRADGVPFNAQTRAALSPTRAAQLFQAAVERYVQGMNSEAFLKNC